VAEEIAVYIESGRSRVFAVALEWPGWSRAGKTEGAALEALARYAGRYAPVPQKAGVPFPASIQPSDFRVVERLTGSKGADFGVPDLVPTADNESLVLTEAQRLAALLEAAWATFDDIAAKAPAILRKGPRGGGRDRDRLVEHVLGAETMYARRIGVRQQQPALGDTRAIATLREEILGIVRAAPPTADKGWPIRYAARRIAWHVLDHAWEAEDRGQPEKA